MGRANGNRVLTPRTAGEDDAASTRALRLKIREIYDGGVSPEAIAAVLDVPLDLVRVFCEMRVKPSDG